MAEKKDTWDNAENLVSEVFRDNQRQAKRWFIAFLIMLLSLIATNAYWIYQWNSYDYVSQDGDGYNYYNSDIGGDVSNGAENPETEEQEESQRDQETEEIK